MSRLFGTDGVRGLANVDLSPLLALKLGTTAAHVLVERHGDARIVVGRDPRISGDILECALVAGICSQGAEAILVGVIPTAGVAYLTAKLGASAGAVISASHNPMPDNGIKFFGPDGYKLDDSIEERIEQEIKKYDSFRRPSGAAVGRMHRKHALSEEYLTHVKSTAKRRLDGLRIVVDCANGAACEFAPRLFADLGAEVFPLHCEPDGTNINADCGSLHPGSMQAEVRAHRAHVGVSFDGDADRAIIADENGSIVDGDHVMAICSLSCARAGDLPGNAVVATVMSNIGLEIALARENVTLIRTPVGDRYVSEEMRRVGAIIGGEKSGHLIFSRHSTTGDGMITAIQVLEIMLSSGSPLSELAAEMQEFPQLLVNVRVKERDGWDRDSEIRTAIVEAEHRLKGRGRVLVRPSGTEKLIRVMAEGPDQDELEEITGAIAKIVKSRLG